MRAIIKSYILITIALMISVQCMSTNTNTLSRSYVNGNFEVTGEFMQWHKVTITLDGPNAKETDSEPNPFTDYNFTVTFTHESGSSVYVVTGYFAAYGDAANTSAQSGNKWRAYLVPDKAGMWN